MGIIIDNIEAQINLAHSFNKEPKVIIISESLKEAFKKEIGAFAPPGEIYDFVPTKYLNLDVTFLPDEFIFHGAEMPLVMVSYKRIDEIVIDVAKGYKCPRCDKYEGDPTKVLKRTEPIFVHAPDPHLWWYETIKCGGCGTTYRIRNSS